MLWVPAWTWHRVDYIADQPALSVSMFHVRPYAMFANSMEMAVLALPNMLKELLTLKTA